MPQTDPPDIKTCPHLIAVILNTNRREDTLACLASLEENRYPHLSVIVLDNASGDGSVEAIASAHPDVKIIRLGQNLGYAGNNNVGIGAARKMGADWVLILNEDTVLAADCLAQLVAAGESDPRIGIIGPMVYHYDEPDIIQSAGGKLGRRWEPLHLAQNEPETGQFPLPHEVDWISGCALMVRRPVIDQAGMIDARYFYYWEETEFCIRVRESGWRVVHVPQARLWHKGVQRNYRPSPQITYYATRNRLLTLSKHRAPLLVWLSVYAELLRTMTSWTLRPKWRMMRPHRNALCRGMIDFMCRRWGRMS